MPAKLHRSLTPHTQSQASLDIITRSLQKKMKGQSPGQKWSGEPTMETIWLQRPTADLPWGFRLQGGSDFGLPFTVQRVTANSVAASHLGQGDVILKIGTVMAGDLTHLEAQELIRRADCILQLTVKRADNPTSPPPTSSSSSPHQQPQPAAPTHTSNQPRVFTATLKVVNNDTTDGPCMSKPLHPDPCESISGDQLSPVSQGSVSSQSFRSAGPVSQPTAGLQVSGQYSEPRKQTLNAVTFNIALPQSQDQAGYNQQPLPQMSSSHHHHHHQQEPPRASPDRQVHHAAIEGPVSPRQTTVHHHQQPDYSHPPPSLSPNTTPARAARSLSPGRPSYVTNDTAPARAARTLSPGRPSYVTNDAAPARAARALSPGRPSTVARDTASVREPGLSFLPQRSSATRDSAPVREPGLSFLPQPSSVTRDPASVREPGLSFLPRPSSATHTSSDCQPSAQGRVSPRPHQTRCGGLPQHDKDQFVYPSVKPSEQQFEGGNQTGHNGDQPGGSQPEHSGNQSVYYGNQPRYNGIQPALSGKNASETAQSVRQARISRSGQDQPAAYSQDQTASGDSPGPIQLSPVNGSNAREADASSRAVSQATEPQVPQTMWGPPAGRSRINSAPPNSYGSAPANFRSFKLVEAQSGGHLDVKPSTQSPPHQLKESVHSMAGRSPQDVQTAEGVFSATPMLYHAPMQAPTSAVVRTTERVSTSRPRPASVSSCRELGGPRSPFAVQSPPTMSANGSRGLDEGPLSSTLASQGFIRQEPSFTPLSPKRFDGQDSALASPGPTRSTYTTHKYDGKGLTSTRTATPYNSQGQVLTSVNTTTPYNRQGQGLTSVNTTTPYNSQGQGLTSVNTTTPYNSQGQGLTSINTTSTYNSHGQGLISSSSAPMYNSQGLTSINTTPIYNSQEHELTSTNGTPMYRGQGQDLTPANITPTYNRQALPSSYSAATYNSQSPTFYTNAWQSKYQGPAISSHSSNKYDSQGPTSPSGAPTYNGQGQTFSAHTWQAKDQGPRQGPTFASVPSSSPMPQPAVSEARAWQLRGSDGGDRMGLVSSAPPSVQQIPLAATASIAAPPPPPPPPPPLPPPASISAAWGAVNRLKFGVQDKEPDQKLPDELLSSVLQSKGGPKPFTYGVDLGELKTKISPTPTPKMKKKTDTSSNGEDHRSSIATSPSKPSPGHMQHDHRLEREKGPRGEVDESPINVHMGVNPNRQSMSFRVLQWMTDTDDTQDDPTPGVTSTAQRSWSRAARGSKGHNPDDDDDEKTFSGLHPTSAGLADRPHAPFYNTVSPHLPGPSPPSAIHTQGKDVADAGLTSGGNEEGTDRRYMGGHIPSKLFHTLQKSVGASTQLQPIPEQPNGDIIHDQSVQTPPLTKTSMSAFTDL